MRILSRAVLNIYLVSICWLQSMNSGPGPPPLAAKKGTIAFTGHILWPVCPSDKVIPRRKGSVLDCLMLTWTI